MKTIQNPRICTFLLKGDDGSVKGYGSPYICHKCMMPSNTEKCPRCGGKCSVRLF